MHLGKEQPGDADIVLEIVDPNHCLIREETTGLANEGAGKTTDVDDHIAFDAVQNFALTVR